MVCRDFRMTSASSKSATSSSKSRIHRLRNRPQPGMMRVTVHLQTSCVTSARSTQAVTKAKHHCVQCSMSFCQECVGRHASNAVFQSHHVVDLHNENEASTVFCRTHKDQSVRYFCKVCNTMLCTICTLSHNPDHNPVLVDRHVIQSYQQDLTANLKSIRSKLNEVSSRTKYLETVRHAYQKALYDSQAGIRSRAEELVRQIREQERKLLDDTQQRMDSRMRSLGLDSLGEMNFHKANIENLHLDVQHVIKGSPAAVPGGIRRSHQPDEGRQ